MQRCPRVEQRPIAVVRRRLDLGERHQHVAFGIGPRLVGKGQVDAVIGGALGDQTLRAVERIDAELQPAAPLHQLLLDLHVEEVMPRITLVTTEVQRAREADRQVGVEDRKSVVEGKSVSVVVYLGGGSIIKKNKNN